MFPWIDARTRAPGEGNVDPIRDLPGGFGAARSRQMRSTAWAPTPWAVMLARVKGGLTMNYSARAGSGVEKTRGCESA